MQGPPHSGKLYYECLYDILREVDTHETNITTLNHIKAKIFKLHSARLRTSFLDTTEADQIAGEQPMLSQHIQRQQRRTARTFRSYMKITASSKHRPKELPSSLQSSFEPNTTILKSTPKA